MALNSAQPIPADGDESAAYPHARQDSQPQYQGRPEPQNQGPIHAHEHQHIQERLGAGLGAHPAHHDTSYDNAHVPDGAIHAHAQLTEPQDSESPRRAQNSSNGKTAGIARPYRRQGEASVRSGSERVEIGVNDLHHLIPTNWALMSGFIGAAYLFFGLTMLVVPSGKCIIWAAVSVALTGLGHVAARIERTGKVGRFGRYFLLCLTVVAPMAIMGWVYTDLAVSGVLDWHWSMAALISLNSVAVALLSRRLSGLFMSMIACWAAVTIYDGSTVAYFAFTAGCLVMGFAARYQYQLENARLEDEEQQERLRRRAEEILSDYEETGQGWFWETDRRGHLTYISHPVAKLLGAKTDDLIGRPINDLFDLDDETREGERTLQFHLTTRSSFQDLRMRAADKVEERYWSISGRPLYDTFKNFSGFRGSGTDLTEKHLSQQQATRLAHYDSLTGLANRHQMSQSLEKILSAPQASLRECSVFLLDLDRFKQVNDTLGHPAGDALLQQVAMRLESVLERSYVGERGRVGRLGGDEFEVIVQGRVPPQTLAQLGHDIITSLSHPYLIDGHRVVIGASVGIAMCPEHGETSEDLIRNADLALYSAKDGGRGRYAFFAKDLHSAAEERAALEQDLRDAISSGALELHYQPVVHTATERIAGFEALLRWNHPVKGYLSPAKFIPVAEEAGLISQIGEWAIRTACNDLAKWPKEVRCAVNVSTLQFANPQLPTVITNALAQSGIEPSRLELEITESVFLEDDAQVDRMFAALKGIGVRLALDDFGTGYSSLGYLKKAPFDKIKIDQSFVRGATQEGSRNGAIIASIVSLAQALGMDTTAEGVENFDELEMVRVLGCSHVQGYIYEKALSAEAADARLKTGLHTVANGPKSSRAKRHTTLRKVTLQHHDQTYYGTVRNLSESGALVAGLWNVPLGTVFKLALDEDTIVNATTRWSQEDRMGVEFDTPLSDQASAKLRSARQAA